MQALYNKDCTNLKQKGRTEMRAIIRYTDPEGRSLDLIRVIRRTIHNKMPDNYNGPTVPDATQEVRFTREEIVEDDGSKHFTDWHSDDPYWSEYDPSDEVPGYKPDTNLIVSKEVTPETEPETFVVDYTPTEQTQIADESVNELANATNNFDGPVEANSADDKYGAQTNRSRTTENSQLNPKEHAKLKPNNSNGLEENSTISTEDYNKILGDQIARAAAKKTDASFNDSSSNSNNEDYQNTDNLDSAPTNKAAQSGAKASSNNEQNSKTTFEKEESTLNKKIIPDVQVVTNSRVIKVATAASGQATKESNLKNKRKSTNDFADLEQGTALRQNSMANSPQNNSIPANKGRNEDNSQAPLETNPQNSFSHSSALNKDNNLNSSANQMRTYIPFVGSAARMHEAESAEKKDPRLYNEGEDVSDQYATTKINGKEIVLSKAPVAEPASKIPAPEPEEFVKPYKAPRHAQLIPLSPHFAYLRQDEMTAAILRQLEIIGYFYFEENEWKSVEFNDPLFLESTLNNPL